MNQNLSPARRRWRDVFRAGAALSAVMLGVTVVTAMSAQALPSGTAPTTGLSLAPTSGNKTSTWSFTLASNGSTLAAGTNSCPGDGNSTPAMTWQTFMVPASFDAATLTFSGLGLPNNASLTYAKPLYSGSGGTAISNQTVNFGDGIIPLPGSFSFAPLSSASIPPNGQYKVGIACTQGGQTMKYWQLLITVTNSSTTGFDFTVNPSPVTTTTTTVAGSSTTTTTTVAGSSTSSTSTTSTVRPTTTTTAGSSTTTTIAGAAGPVTTTGVVTLPGFFPTTGSSSSGLIAFWAVMLLVFGRIAILLARPVRVVPDKSR